MNPTPLSVPLLLVLAGCNLGLDTQKPRPDDRDTGTAGLTALCTGNLQQATLAGDAMTIVALIRCDEDVVDRWRLELGGQDVGHGPGTGPDVDINEVVDVGSLGLTGVQPLALLASDGDDTFVELDRMDVTLPGGGSDTVDVAVRITSASPVGLLPGDDVTVNGRVSSLGAEDAGPFDVTLYLSSDATWDGGDRDLSTFSWDALPTGDAEDWTLHATIPAGTPAGDQYLVARTDLADADRTNNEDATGIFVEDDGTDDPADLELNAPTLSVASADPGDRITVSGTLYNTGDQDAGAFSVGIALSSDTRWDAADTSLGSVPESGLRAGGSVAWNQSVTVPSSTATGTWYVLTKADADDDVAEGDETDNTGATALTVGSAGTPDLEADPPSPSSSTVAAGAAVDVSGTLTNGGTAASGTFQAGLYLSSDAAWSGGDTTLATWSEASLAPGGSSTWSETVSIPAATAAGTWYLVVQADRSRTVTEADETNNAGSTAITVTSDHADLTVSTPALTPSTTSAGEDVSVEATITNGGTADSGSFTAGIYLSTNATWDSRDTRLTSWSEASLAPGATSDVSRTVTIPSATSSGTWYVLVVADTAEVVSEPDEGDNTGVARLTLPDIDLWVYYVSVYPSSGEAGSSTSLSGTVYNYEGDPSGSYTMAYYLSANRLWDTSDTLITSKTMPSISGYGSDSFSQSVTIPTGTAAGTWYLLAVADPDDFIPESDETNNLEADSFTVVVPDLEPSHSVYPSSVAAGGTVSSSYTIYNYEDGDAVGAVIAWYLSTDNRFDAADTLLSSVTESVSSWGYAYGSETLTIPSATTAGSWYVLCVADPDGLVEETDEANNVDPASVTVR